MQTNPIYEVGDYVDFNYVTWVNKIVIEITPENSIRLKDPRPYLHNNIEVPSPAHRPATSSVPNSNPFAQKLVLKATTLTVRTCSLEHVDLTQRPSNKYCSLHAASTINSQIRLLPVLPLSQTHHPAAPRAPLLLHGRTGLQPTRGRTPTATSLPLHERTSRLLPEVPAGTPLRNVQPQQHLRLTHERTLLRLPRTQRSHPLRPRPQQRVRTHQKRKLQIPQEGTVRQLSAGLGVELSIASTASSALLELPRQHHPLSLLTSTQHPQEDTSGRVRTPSSRHAATLQASTRQS